MNKQWQGKKKRREILILQPMIMTNEEYFRVSNKNSKGKRRPIAGHEGL
jgi:hypothetical protein